MRRRPGSDKLSLAGTMAGWTGDGHRHLRRRFWYGTMRNNPAPGGGDPDRRPSRRQPRRIDPDGAVTRVDGPFGISNTLAWSPDHWSIRFGGTLGVIFARGFDLRGGSGNGRDRRVHALRDAAPALPDGEFAADMAELAAVSPLVRCGPRA